jgi:hypothetical protein
MTIETERWNGFELNHTTHSGETWRAVLMRFPVLCDKLGGASPGNTISLQFTGRTSNYGTLSVKVSPTTKLSS